jgi:hypothetical protein
MSLDFEEHAAALADPKGDLAREQDGTIGQAKNRVRASAHIALLDESARCGLSDSQSWMCLVFGQPWHSPLVQIFGGGRVSASRGDAG